MLKLLKPLPVSVFIIAKNEADRIATSINSVKDWVDEVIVVDSGSSDDTMKIAESLGAKVFFRSWNGYGEQKRYGEEQCKNRWLLNLDADEEISSALAEDIKKLFAGGDPYFSGYILRVCDMLPGEITLSRFAHTNHCLRLYNKEEGRFSPSAVHDSVIMNNRNAEIPELIHPVYHRSFRSLSHAIEKMNSYSNAQANDLTKKGKVYSLWRLLFEFPLAFCKIYFLRTYMFRGRLGFVYAINYAFGRFMRIAKTSEQQDTLF